MLEFFQNHSGAQARLKDPDPFPMAEDVAFHVCEKRIEQRHDTVFKCADGKHPEFSAQEQCDTSREETGGKFECKESE